MLLSPEIAAASGSAEERLKEIEGHLVRVVQAAYLISFEWDIRTNQVRRVFSSEPALPAGEAPATLEAVADRVHPEDRSLFLANVHAAVADPAGLYASEYRLLRSDGHVAWLQERGWVERDAAGQPVRLVGISQNVTARIEFERRVVESESTLRTFYESCPLMIGVVEVPADNADILLQSYNVATERFFGLPRGTEPLRGARELGFSPDKIALWTKHYRQSEATGMPVRFEYQDVMGGRPLWFSAVVACIGTTKEDRTRFSFVVEDITERKQAEKRISDQARMIDISGDAIIGRDHEDRVVHWNEGAHRLYGFTAEEALGRNVHELLQSSNDHPVAELSVRTRREGAWEGELLHRRKDGATVMVLSRWVADHGNGHAGFILESNTDITERKRIEAVLRASEEKFRAVFEHAPTGICIADLEGRLLEWNPAMARIVRRNPAELLRRRFTDLVHPEDRAESLRRVQRLLEDKIPSFELENRYVAPGGEAIWVRKWVSLLRDSGRRPTRMMVLVTEVTEQRAAMEALREEEIKFRQLAENLPQLAWMTDAKGQVIWYNQRWYDYTGTTFEQMRGNGWPVVHHPEHFARVSGNWAAALQLGTPWEDTFPLRDRRGRFRWFLSRAFPIRDTTGRITRWFGTNTDIDDLRTAEEALRSAQVELKRYTSRLEATIEERTAKLRETISELEHFSYTITHDMRAPLRAMQSFGEILQQEYAGGLDEQGRNYVGRIVRAASRMDRLITDALDYSKAVQTEVRLEPIGPGPLLRGILESYPQLQPPAAEVRLDEPFPAVLANEAGLTQCLSNLLTNAVKFVAPGTLPRVRVWAERRGSEIRIWVEDNGVGIAPEQRDRVFQLFQRLDRRFEGTGVGLALVRKVVQRMRGRAGFEPRPEGGTRFWVEFSAAEAPAA